MITFRAIRWRLRYLPLLWRARQHRATPTSPWIAGLVNQRENTGGLVLTSQIQPAAARTGGRRAVDTPGFEGLALDDALVFMNGYKHLSYIGLSRAIAEIGRTEFGQRSLSILELGSGGGDLFYFLRGLGVKDYLGIDANPLPFQLSPFVRNSRNFRLLNLQEGIDFSAAFDIVCSFEVLEHIREEALDAILGTIGRHLGHQSIFLGTASLLEDHDVHVTVRPRPYWLDRFAAHSMVPHPAHEAYERALSRDPPFNWTPASSNVFALCLDPRTAHARKV